jgi:hypothetical protein
MSTSQAAALSALASLVALTFGVGVATAVTAPVTWDGTNGAGMVNACRTKVGNTGAGTLRVINTRSGGVCKTTEVPLNWAQGFASHGLQEFTTGGVWTAPAGINSVEVQFTGGGGSGACPGTLASHMYNTDYYFGGGGGGAGGTIDAVVPVNPGTTYTVNIAAATEPPNCSASQADGNKGGDSSLVTGALTLAVAHGGAGGKTSSTDATCADPVDSDGNHTLVQTAGTPGAAGEGGTAQAVSGSIARTGAQSTLVAICTWGDAINRGAGSGIGAGGDGGNLPVANPDAPIIPPTAGGSGYGVLRW